MSSTVRALWQAVAQASKALQLESFKRVTVRIDPFHSNATAVRDFLYHVSASRVRLTNPECSLKTEVLCDRSEPTVDIAFVDGRRAVVRCGHLSCLEVLQTVGRLGVGAAGHGQGSQ